MSDQDIEKEIQEKGLTAPRLTMDDIEANIFSEHYFTADNGVFGCAAWDVFYGGNHDGGFLEYDTHASLDLLTFCVLVLRNGFTVTGVYPFEDGKTSTRRRAPYKREIDAISRVIESKSRELVAKIREEFVSSNTGGA